MNEIVMIPIEKLRHHPMNPRKNLGDLTELTESIRTQGIMQNLTVVPGVKYTDTWYVVIGNRRMEACKAAGLTELPCVIADMDMKEVMSTMISENMQRADLTIAEQAQSIQLMMEMGLTEADISKKTGLSATTVGRRVKLAKLPKDDVEAAQEKGVTIMDLLELMEIRDEEKRNKILKEEKDKSRFQSAVTVAMNEQKTKDKMETILKRVEEFAEPIKMENRWNKEWTRPHYWTLDEAMALDELEPEDAKAVPYFYYISTWNVELWCKKTARGEEEDPKLVERARINREITRVGEMIKGIKKEASERRMKFVKDIEITEKADRYIRDEWLRTLFSSQENATFEKEDVLAVLGITEEGQEYDDFWGLITERKIPETKVILAMMVSGMLLYGNEGYVHWNNSWEANEELDLWYEFLQGLGYEMTAEEIQMKDGTHPLFHELEELKNAVQG